MAKAAPKYLQQKDGSCCGLYALCNALRYFGRPSPSPDTREWERLVDRIGCRHGSAVRIDEVAAHLRLHRERIDGDVFDVPRRLPTTLSVYRPDGCLHVVLVIGAKASRLRLVNYRTDGPVVEDVAVRELKFPPPHLQHAWAITEDRATESSRRTP